jgi:hypothetical protein
MQRKSGPVLRYLAALAVLFAGLGAGRMAGAESAWTCRPQRPDARSKPSGVPVDCVFTQNGFLHSSYVTHVQTDEILGADFDTIAERGPIRHARGRGGGNGGGYAMECEVQYGHVQSKLVEVNPGDTLPGTVTPSACNSKGVSAWTITINQS